MVGKATPDRGGPRKSPDGVDPKTSGWASKRIRKTQRDGHNSGVKIWSLCSVSSTLSHANLEQPFRTLAIKWEVNIIVKKTSCVSLPAFLSCVVYSCVSLWCCVVVMLNDDVDDYITLYYNIELLKKLPIGKCLTLSYQLRQKRSLHLRTDSDKNVNLPSKDSKLIK